MKSSHFQKPSAEGAASLLRTFVAVPFPMNLEMKKALEEWIAAFPASRIKWADPASLHLTLSFLGDTSPEQAAVIAAGLAAAWAGLPAFDVTIRGIGIFGSTAEPRVIWMGIAEGEDRLARLKTLADSVIGKAGIRLENRPFKPHLTLARPKMVREKGRLSQLLKIYEQQDFGRIRIDRLVFFESRLRPEGPLHIPLQEYLLEKG